jgi:hypothetical protein
MRILTPRNARLPSSLQEGQHVDVTASREKNGVHVLRQLRVLDPKTDDLTRQHDALADSVHIRGELTALDPGTLYSLNWVPIGGFCRMTGEEDPGDRAAWPPSPSGSVWRSCWADP